jgi:hypothetical protein
MKFQNIAHCLIALGPVTSLVADFAACVCPGKRRQRLVLFLTVA